MNMRRRNRRVGLAGDLPPEMLEAVLKAKPPAEADREDEAIVPVDALKGCVSYKGAPKTLQEMEDAISRNATGSEGNNLQPEN
jgi:hypothetical protein